jgi:hypothetical protein
VDDHLDKIVTDWDALRLAHGSSVTMAGPARNTLALRYRTAIRRYLGALVRDEHEADDLAQEVQRRLLNGDFAAADPGRGRFRDLLKVAVRNMVRTRWSSKQRRAEKSLDLARLADEADGPLAEKVLNATWRRSLLELAQAALEEHDRTHPGSVLGAVLRLRIEHPDDDSAQLAVRLSAAAGRPFRADATRQQLRRARVRFAQLLIEEVARGQNDPTPERIEEDLIEIGLMEYVRDFLPPDWRTRGQLW